MLKRVNGAIIISINNNYQDRLSFRIYALLVRCHLYQCAQKEKTLTQQTTVSAVITDDISYFIPQKSFSVLRLRLSFICVNIMLYFLVL